MRIALVSTSATNVSRAARGSIEGLVWLLSRELTALGHAVTVFAAAGSDVSGELVASLPGTYGQNGSPDDWQLCEWIGISRAIEQAGRFDVIHSHNYLWAIPFEQISRTPLVHTLHICPSESEQRLWQMWPDACVTAISRFQWQPFPQLHPAAVIYHGVDESQFTFRAAVPDDYVCFLGRFMKQKGPLEAIAAARALGLRIVLAGPSSAYYEQHIAPLVDGDRVQYIGSVTGPSRDELLSRARALLYPIQTPEPFGLVMPEAMMCGTPVVAMRLGAVPEIIDDGITGYAASTMAEFQQRISQSFVLDRQRVRQMAETRFSARRMARGYEQVYRQVIAARASGGAKAQ